MPPFHSISSSPPMTIATDASPKERRIGLLWGIFIFVALGGSSRELLL